MIMKLSCRNITCKVMMCMYVDEYAVSRTCSEGMVNICPPDIVFRQSDLANLTFFRHGSSCCLGTSSPLLGVEGIECFCQMDNCNGDLPHQIPNAGGLPSTTANRISTQSTIAQRKSSDGFSPQPIRKLSIVFVAIIAVLSIISW